MKIKTISIILLTLTLNGCGGSLVASHIIDYFATPSSLMMTATDYIIENETGKKVSEHVLSAATSKDCKLSIELANICKDEISFGDTIVTTLKSSFADKIN
jgi:hypothetical protein